MESPSQLWASLSIANILEIVAAAVLVTTLLERTFNVEFVGRRIFRLIGRIFKFLIDWLTWPIKPKIAAVKAVLEHGDRLDKSLKIIIETDKEREERRAGQFAEIRRENAGQMEKIAGLELRFEKIEKELTLNGGQSLKDQVTRLVRHDKEKWGLIETILAFVEVTSLRLDIADEARKCMTFKLAADGSCIAISPMFLRTFGYTERDLLGTDWEFCIAKQSLADVQAKWAKAFLKRQHYRNDQFIIDSDGREHYCRVQGYPMPPNNEGEFQGFYGTVEILDADAAKH